MPTTQRPRADDTYRSLRALEAIEENPHISQRELAARLDVALGIANACVHTLVRKGLIKIRGESNRSITYHLTKAGLAQKARLAMEWTANTIDFYRQARQQMRDQLGALAARGVVETVVYGADEIAELLLMVASESGVRVAGVIAPEGPRIGDRVLGMPVLEIADLEGLAFDSVVLTTEPTGTAVAELTDTLERVRPVPVYTLGGALVWAPGMEVEWR